MGCSSDTGGSGGRGGLSWYWERRLHCCRLADQPGRQAVRALPESKITFRPSLGIGVFDRPLKSGFIVQGKCL